MLLKYSLKSAEGVRMIEEEQDVLQVSMYPSTIRNHLLSTVLRKTLSEQSRAATANPVTAARDSFV